MNEAIYQLIDKFDVISFDFYGTLFYRAISDSDNVFKLVEKEFNILDQKKIYRFKTQRVRAER